MSRHAIPPEPLDEDPSTSLKRRKEEGPPPRPLEAMPAPAIYHLRQAVERLIGTLDRIEPLDREACEDLRWEAHTQVQRLYRQALVIAQRARR